MILEVVLLAAEREHEEVKLLAAHLQESEVLSLDPRFTSVFILLTLM